VSFNVPFCRLQIATIFGLFFNLRKATTGDNSIERYIFKVIFVSTTGKVRDTLVMVLHNYRVACQNFDNCSEEYHIAGEGVEMLKSQQFHARD